MITKSSPEPPSRLASRVATGKAYAMLTDPSLAAEPTRSVRIDLGHRLGWYRSSVGAEQRRSRLSGNLGGSRSDWRGPSASDRGSTRPLAEQRGPPMSTDGDETFPAPS